MEEPTQKRHMEQFGPYLVQRRLGLGGMASVHLATHQVSGKEVALKRLLPQYVGDRSIIRQFVREAEIGKALVHPNIARVEEFGEFGGIHFLAMERVDGRSLLSLLRRANEDCQPPPVGVSLWVLGEVLKALDYAMTGLDAEGKAFNIVHRDLSPSNIIVTHQGEVKLIDFGVAKSLVGRHATNSGHVKGKLGYMSPETLSGGQIDSRSDLYSAAIVAWELLTAQRLFRGSEQEQLKLRAEGAEQEPPSGYNPWVPRQVDELLAIALSQEPALRWPSAAAMRNALAPLLRRQGSGASREATLKWIRQLDIGEGVQENSETNFHLALPEQKKKFLADIPTLLDPVPFELSSEEGTQNDWEK